MDIAGNWILPAGSRHLRANDSIRARVAELQGQIAAAVVEETAVDEVRVVSELARVAFSDIRKVVSWEPEIRETIEESEDSKVVTITCTVSTRVTVTPSDKINEETAAGIASISQSPNGMLQVRMHSKIEALKALSARFRPAEVAPQQFNQNVPFIDRPPPETREQWIERQARMAEEDQRREDGKLAPQ